MRSKSGGYGSRSSCFHLAGFAFRGKRRCRFSHHCRLGVGVQEKGFNSKVLQRTGSCPPVIFLNSTLLNSDVVNKHPHITQRLLYIMTTSNKTEIISDDEQAFISAMHQAAQKLLIDDSSLSNTRPLNYQIYYKIYERYINRVLEIERRMNELCNQEHSLINEQRRLDKTRDDIKQKINGAGGVNVQKEGYKRQKLQQKEEEKSVYIHSFPSISQY